MCRLDSCIRYRSVHSFRSITNDVFTEDDLLGRRDLILGRITQHHKPRPVPQATIVQTLVSDILLAMYTGQVSSRL